MKRRFSISAKVALLFGLLFLSTGILLEIAAIRISRAAVAAKIEAHLRDNVLYIAALLDEQGTEFMKFFQGLARIPELRDESIPFSRKAKDIAKELSFGSNAENITVCDLNGKRYDSSGSVYDVSNMNWYKSAKSGKNAITEPVVTGNTGDLHITFAVPIYDDNKKVVGVLASEVSGLLLCNAMRDIVIGNMGECYVLGPTGTTIAHGDSSMVAKQFNPIKAGESDSTYASMSEFTKTVLNSNESKTGRYVYLGTEYIAANALMKSTGWTVIIKTSAAQAFKDISRMRILLISFFSNYIYNRNNYSVDYVD